MCYRHKDDFDNNAKWLKRKSCNFHRKMKSKPMMMTIIMTNDDYNDNDNTT